MIPRTNRALHRVLDRCLLATVVWCYWAGSGIGAAVQENSAFGQGEAVAQGGVVGEVSLPGDVDTGSVVQALLLPGEWASEWKNDVQERLRVYFANNARAVDQDRSLFDQIAFRARRESTAYVAARMQANLGPEGYEELVTGVAEDGTFEFNGLEAGEYQIVVVAAGERATYLWAQPVRVSGPLPQFVDMGPHFQ